MIVLIGDSLTQFGSNTTGWAAKLTEIYNRKLDILNRGLSGYTTKWYPKEIYEHLPPANLVTVWLGANDACIDTVQQVQINDFEQNLRRILASVSKQCKNIILLTPPPLDELKWPDRKNSNTFEYRNRVIALAQEFKIPVIDTWTVLGILGGSTLDLTSTPTTADPFQQPSQLLLDYHFHDGLHLSDQGNLLIYEALLNEIKSQFPLLNPDTLKPTFPWWRDRALLD
jgi:lysophospholipase L1-like esterase